MLLQAPTPLVHRHQERSQSKFQLNPTISRQERAASLQPLQPTSLRLVPPEHQGVASTRAGAALHATPVAAETVPPSRAVAEHVQAQYLLGEVDKVGQTHQGPGLSVT